ncbi:MAG: V-type ATP synthase subunit I, partial [Clostridia bacterium]
WSIAGLGVVMLMVAGMLGKKGFKKASGAFGNLYGIINFFSDLMSYTRIFGLGLATSVIGMVFNQIGMVIKDLVPSQIKFIGWIIAIAVFVIGHIFNIGI